VREGECGGNIAYEKGKMRPVETVLGIAGERDRGE
jgi:hypothetical protein